MSTGADPHHLHGNAPMASYTHSGLYNNVVITTALVWDQCFSMLQEDFFRTSSFFLSETFGHLQLSLFTSTKNIPYLGIFQVLWSLNRTGFPWRRQLTPLFGNRAVLVRWVKRWFLEEATLFDLVLSCGGSWKNHQNGPTLFYNVFS